MPPSQVSDNDLNSSAPDFHPIIRRRRIDVVRPHLTGYGRVFTGRGRNAVRDWLDLCVERLVSDDDEMERDLPIPEVCEFPSKRFFEI